VNPAEHFGPEARLARAREFYEHAVRMGNPQEIDKARAQIAEASSDLADEVPLPDEAVRALQVGVDDLRAWLELESKPSGIPPEAPGDVDRSVVRYRRPSDDWPTDPAGIAGLVGHVAPATLVTVVELSRLEIVASGQIRLAELRAAMAQATQEGDTTVAAAERELVEISDRIRELHKFELQSRAWDDAALRVFASRSGQVVFGLVAMALTAVQVLISRFAFVELNLGPLETWIAALGYAVLLGVGGSLAGLLWRRRGALPPQMRSISLFAIASLVLVLLGTFAIAQLASQSRLGIGSEPYALLTIWVLSMGCVSIAFAGAYFGFADGSGLARLRIVEEQLHRLADRRDHLVTERNRAMAHRHAVLKRYVGQAHVLVAEARYTEVAFMRHAVSHMPDGGDYADFSPRFAPPDWLADAENELAETSGSPRPVSPLASSGTRSYRSA
jgi:hypothetical protein